MEREKRYLVFKYTDACAALSFTERGQLADLADRVHAYRSSVGKAPLECVVVESDWPEYEPTWAAIEKRVDETPNALREPHADNETEETLK